ncbi:MAG: site-specific DNA-methyltransferase, partial [Phycisphaerae bacterium]
MADDWKNTLYYGDNLDVLRRHVADESVDLVYLDPPFNSNATYNVLFAERNGSRAAAQIKAFEDTWEWDEAAAKAYEETVEAGGLVSRAMQAFRTFLGDSDMLAYLAMMAPRLVELRRVLKPTGSVYLHCDPTASHYLKMLMDAVFGPENFLNEIVWSYRRYTAKSRRFQRLHDAILFYGRSDRAVFNDMRGEYGEKSGVADSHYKQDDEGRWYRWQKRKGQEPYKIFLSPEGRRLGDVWDIPH